VSGSLSHLTDLLRSQAWFFGQGESLPVEPEYDTTLAEAAYALAKRWDESRSSDTSSLKFSKEDLDDFNSNQKGARYMLLLAMFVDG